MGPRNLLNNNLMHITDWYPTILAAASRHRFSLADAAAENVDGFDQWDAIKEIKATPRKEMVYNIKILPMSGAVR